MAGRRAEAQGEAAHDEGALIGEGLIGRGGDKGGRARHVVLALPGGDLPCQVGFARGDYRAVGGVRDDAGRREVGRAQEMVPVGVRERHERGLRALRRDERGEHVHFVREHAGVDQQRLAFAEKDAAVHGENRALLDPEVPAEPLGVRGHEAA